MAMTDIQSLLGEEHEYLLAHVCRGITAQMLHPPGPDFIDRVVTHSDQLRQDASRRVRTTDQRAPD